MESMYYIGLDVHKKTISYGVKDARSVVHENRRGSDGWQRTVQMGIIGNYCHKPAGDSGPDRSPPEIVEPQRGRSGGFRKS